MDVIFLCQQLFKDLIFTISRGFPDYYETNVMFLSGPYRIPAGCSALTANMHSFESFLRGITDYDYWFVEDMNGYQGNGEELLFKKLKINTNYEKVKIK